MKNNRASAKGSLKLRSKTILGALKIKKKAANARGVSKNNLGIFIGSIENFGVIIKLTPPNVAIIKN
jgi:hypothetical protein